jgi:hypothetical protein
MTWNDLVREYIPNATDEFADWVLWERTCFPMGSVAAVRQHLQEFKDHMESQCKML